MLAHVPTTMSVLMDKDETFDKGKRSQGKCLIVNNTKPVYYADQLIEMPWR
jgi:hypothetical protein